MNNISPIVNYFANQGVPLETVKLLLMFPIIATMIAFLRQVIGIKAFGIYTPSIIIFAFFATGIKYGAALFASVILVGMVVRFLLKRFKILYLPRVAITLSIVALAMLFFLTFGGSLQRTGLASVSIFPLLIMITLVEKFIAAQIEKGNRTAFLLALETLVISIFGYYLLKWQFLVRTVMAFPWAILLIIPINIMLGKWTGLRISEYFRFREVFKKM
ncbi:MAG: 7TM domain-containing protein [bacterium]|nr:7TM domain-containing protein [bacterium]